jgi:hypothetical protein
MWLTAISFSVLFLICLSAFFSGSMEEGAGVVDARDAGAIG